MTDHRTSREDCPDCSTFERCDYHEGVRHGKEEKEGEVRTLLDELEDEFHVDDLPGPLIRVVQPDSGYVAVWNSILGEHTVIAGQGGFTDTIDNPDAAVHDRCHGCGDKFADGPSKSWRCWTCGPKGPDRDDHGCSCGKDLVRMSGRGEEFSETGVDGPEPAAQFVHTPEGHFILEINAEWIRLLEDDELPEDGDPLFTGEQVDDLLDAVVEIFFDQMMETALLQSWDGTEPLPMWPGWVKAVVEGSVNEAKKELDRGRGVP